MPNSIEKIICGYNLLTEINLPESVKELTCFFNNLILLDNLPNGLEHLDCSDNKITSLDNLPNNLVELYCMNNLLTSLNNLPNSIKKLSFYSNPLDEKLVKLPNNLEELNGNIILQNIIEKNNNQIGDFDNINNLFEFIGF